MRALAVPLRPATRAAAPLTPAPAHARAQLVANRPVSPHVFEITGLQPHYKFPLGAISSITNRATGCMLSVGACGGAGAGPPLLLLHVANAGCTGWGA